MDHKREHRTPPLARVMGVGRQQQQEFEIFLTIIKCYKKSAFICGDFNINLLEIYNNRHFNTYFDSIIANGFFPRITLPTRIQASSCTLIDNIYPIILLKPLNPNLDYL